MPPKHRNNSKDKKKPGPLPSSPMPTAGTPNLPKYAAFILGKHPGMPMVIAEHGFDITKPIKPMDMAGGTMTQIFPEEPFHDADVITVHEGRTADLLERCPVAAYKVLSSAQHALLDAHGGVGLVVYKAMAADPRNAITLANGVVFPGTLGHGPFLEMRTTLLEAAKKQGNINFLIAFA